jgi:uncharacterized protein
MAEAMQFPSSGRPLTQAERRPIAPVWHTIVFVLLVLGFSATSYFTTRKLASGTAASPNARLMTYLFTLAEEWGLCLYVYLGMRSRGMTVRRAINARWARGRDVWRDIGIALVALVAFFAIEGASSVIFRGNNAAASKVLAQLTPQTALELTVWIALAISAGFCEEFMFRGYLQEQFRRLTGSAALGVTIQAVFFGAGHGYQGWALMLTIFFVGLLLGGVAAWRKSLVPTMITHGVGDTIAGVGTFVAHVMHRM